MLYVPEMDVFLDEKLITSYELNGRIVELKEIRHNYFIVVSQNDIVKKVVDFTDLSIALSVYHSIICPILRPHLH